jgi:hypothetical protein
MRARTVGVVAVTIGVWTAAAGGIAQAVHERQSTTSQDQLCQQYEAFTDALVPSRPPGALRLSASRLAALAARYPSRPLPDSTPASEAGTAIRQVLSLPYSTDQDLWAAARPVAVECGVDYRTGSPTMYDGPSALSR